ncbi:uncharacterized protein LOC131076975 [Cryptomeria japonica]|uniref:uncharacterized protein LOC131076975 n=1 Tax=Cryptomeria japonica TaxID=3369 RepID=UPI0027D9D48E|nr:uncharacterized protein LOC131076975 [Cryptomeria japonica]
MVTSNLVMASNSIARSMEEDEKQHGHGDSLIPTAMRRVMVVIDDSIEAESAMLWALSHAVYHSDTLILLHILPPLQAKGVLFAARDPEDPRRLVDMKACWFANSLKALCKRHRPEVIVESVVIDGRNDDIGCLIVSQAQNLQASLLVLGQPKSSFLYRVILRRSSKMGIVEYCINNAECMTVAVRKQSGDLGGYLIRTRKFRNFWMLA